MGSKWEPDDSHLEEGGNAGAAKVDAALKKFKLDLDQILTSRSPAIELVRHELARQDMPAGWLAWQIPVYIRQDVTNFFIQVAQPGSILPQHAHGAAQFRIVISGSLLYNGIELKGGDWIYTPKDAKYSLSVGTNTPQPCIICYAY
jgi:hypothetical protein